MPNRHALKPGDQICLLHIPASAIRRREQELREGVEDAGLTADTIERIIRQNPVVTVDRIDEYFQPWFNYWLKMDDGAIEEHTLAIADDESWEMAR